MKIRNLLILAAVLAFISPMFYGYTTWNQGFDATSNQTITGTWTFTGAVTANIVVIDSITVNYINTDILNGLGYIKFDSTGTGGLSNNAYIDFTLADQTSTSIYWIYMSSTNYWKTSGILEATAGVFGNIKINITANEIYWVYAGAPAIFFGTYYLGLDAGTGNRVGTVRLGDIDAAGEYISVDSLGVPTWVAKGTIFTKRTIATGDSVLGKLIFDNADSTLKIWTGLGWESLH